MSKKVWILTREINAYEQDGEYFVMAFEQKPSIAKLADALKSEHCVPLNVMEAVVFLEHLREGGGRRGVENTWYNLRAEDLR